MKFATAFTFFAGLASLALAAPAPVVEIATAQADAPAAAPAAPELLPRYTWDHSRKFTLRLSVSETLIVNGRSLHISETIVLQVYVSKPPRILLGGSALTPNPQRSRDLNCYNRREPEALPEPTQQREKFISVHISELEEISYHGCHFQVAKAETVLIAERN